MCLLDSLPLTVAVCFRRTQVGGKQGGGTPKLGSSSPSKKRTRRNPPRGKTKTPHLQDASSRGSSDDDACDREATPGSPATEEGAAPRGGSPACL